MSILPPVPQRPLGNTGLSVSVLGYGASSLGGVFTASFDEEEGIRSVHAAFAAGINFFDTSPYYGELRSEKVLGRALQGLPREKLVLSTKVGRYGPEQQHFDFSAARVTASVQESLQRLQTDYIDIIQCHDIEFGDLDQVVTETLPALVKLRDQGIVRHIGITGLPLGIFSYVLDRVPPGTVDVVLSYCHACLLDDALLAAMPYLQSKGIGVVNASPLSMGLLSPQGPPSWHPASAAVKAAAAAAAAVAVDHGSDIAALGLRESIRVEGVSSTLVGMPTRAQVATNVQTVLQALGTIPDAHARTHEAAAEAVRTLLAPVKNKGWPSGRPENDALPVVGAGVGV